MQSCQIGVAFDACFRTDQERFGGILFHKQ